MKFGMSMRNLVCLVVLVLWIVPIFFGTDVLRLFIITVQVLQYHFLVLYLAYYITYLIGKEHKPTLAFQVVVSHTRMFMHVSNYFYGTWNDKQITVNDTYPMDVFGGELFRDLRYVLYTKDGLPITYQGAWLAVDGGYQKAACFINPMHNRFAFPEVVFSEWLESVRKMSNVLLGS